MMNMMMNFARRYLLNRTVQDMLHAKSSLGELRTYDPMIDDNFTTAVLYLHVYIDLNKPVLLNRFHCRHHLRRRFDGEDGPVFPPPHHPYRLGVGDGSLIVSACGKDLKQTPEGPVDCAVAAAVVPLGCAWVGLLVASTQSALSNGLVSSVWHPCQILVAPWC